MKRFLFVVPPLTGHINPTLAVGRLLRARGHEVAWVGHASVLRSRVPSDCTLIELPEFMDPVDFSRLLDRSASVRGLESLQFLWEEVLVPLALQMQAGVERAVDDYAPDLLIVDQQAIAGALIARKRGLRWATLCTTSAALVDPLAEFPRVKEWVDQQVLQLQRDAGLQPVSDADLSPHLVVVFSTNALVGEATCFPDHYLFCGPATSARTEATSFPFDALGDMPRIFVSLGTVSADRSPKFYATVSEAFASVPWRIVLVAPEGMLADPPDNFIVRAFVPQLAVLPHMNAVVSHGGHNTVCEALAHGLPLVITPIRDDQPVVANQVVACGAGLRLKFGRLRPADLREAVRRVLVEPGFKQAASHIAESFASAGGAAAAACKLEELA